MVLHEELSEKKWGSGTIVGHYQDQVHQYRKQCLLQVVWYMPLG